MAVVVYFFTGTLCHKVVVVFFVLFRRKEDLKKVFTVHCNEMLSILVAQVICYGIRKIINRNPLNCNN